MAKAKRLPSGTWRVLLYVGKDETGKRQYESFTADTKAQAELLAAKRKSEIELGIQKEKHPTTMTVGEAMDRYIDDREDVASPKTIRDYRGYRRLYFQRLMSIKVRDLTTEMIQKEINKEAKFLSPKSIYNIWGLLRAALADVNPEAHYRVRLPKRERKEMKIPTNEQLIQLFEYAEGKRIEIPIILAATCGMRRGEIAGLDLAHDVNYKSGEISINKAVVKDTAGEWVVKAPKTAGSKRKIMAPEWVIDKLWSAHQDGYEAMNPDHISTTFAKLSKKLEIHIRFHDLRHYYASLMLALGIPDKYAMANMGHSTPDMLKNVYQHLMEDKKSEFSSQITSYFQRMQHDMQHDKRG